MNFVVMLVTGKLLNVTSASHKTKIPIKVTKNVIFAHIFNEMPQVLISFSVYVFNF